MRKLCLMLLVVACLLPACSLSGTLVLHNSTSDPVTFKFASDGYEDRRYRIASGEVGRISLNVSIDNLVIARIGEDELCYLIPEIPSSWIAPGISGPRIYAKLAPSREIFLFSKDVDENVGLDKEPPSQPEGFPLIATEC